MAVCIVFGIAALSKAETFEDDQITLYHEWCECYGAVVSRWLVTTAGTDVTCYSLQQENFAANITWLLLPLRWDDERTHLGVA